VSIAVYALIGFSSFFLIVVPITGGIVLNPLLALIVDPHIAVSMTVFFFMLNSAIKATIFRQYILYRYFVSMLPLSIIAAIIGTYAIGLIPEIALYGLMLVLTLYFAWKKIMEFLPGYEMPEKKSSDSGNFITSVASGFMQGTGLGGGGSLRKTYFLAHGLSLLQMHGTTSALSVVLGTVSTALRLQTDQVAYDDLLPIIYLIPIMILATIFGKAALIKLSKRTSDRIILITLVTTALLLSYKFTTILLEAIVA
jgi:uncharacterized membrane protein YfcA